jgi:RNA polymerase sigma-70 factor (ECF subfamily)
VIETLELAHGSIGLAATSRGVTADVEHDVSVAYDEHAAKLRAFAIAATRKGDVADDVVQDAFLRLVVELKAGRRPTNVGGWLYRVCANLIVSRGRRSSVADRMRSLLVRREESRSPEDEALRGERSRDLSIALSRLPAQARVALLLASRDMGSADIGIAIHKSPGATRTYLCRARVRLRDELAALGYGSDQ